MPDRSGGIEPIASVVAAATAVPAAVPRKASATRVTTKSRASPRARMPIPIVGLASPISVGVRAPRAATIRPVSGDRMIVGIVIASGRRPVFRTVATDVLEVLRDDEHRPVDAEERGKGGVDGSVVHIDENAHVHHWVARPQLVAHEHHEHDGSDRETAEDDRRQPAVMAPLINAYVRTPMPVMNSNCPGTSKLRLAESRDSLTKPSVSTTAMIPITGLSRKMLRHPTFSVSTPPSVGPMARPTAAIPVQIPIARALASIRKSRADERWRRDIDECGTDALEASRRNEHLDARRQPAGHRRQAKGRCRRCSPGGGRSDRRIHRPTS